jgi:phosphorylase/glycogen(starch) synthase
MDTPIIRPDFVFEVSWEICNKVGGIHTVLATKSLSMTSDWGDSFMMIGPDVWKGTGEHPEFAEDNNLLPGWRAHAASIGLKIKTGRWKITGAPVTILVDFTPFFTQKDEIFRDLWLKCKVDSISGQWDYIEPALFGYAAAKVIESFYQYHLTFSDKIIASFHEWLTGVGVHYLEDKAPQIGTVFTTHATTVGRSIAGNGMPLYSMFDSYNGDLQAKSLNTVAKHSLEKITAAHADAFTTVSELTAKECTRFLGKTPDIITPNGFEDYIVPDTVFFKEKRVLARKKLLDVARAMTGKQIPDDALLMLKSGRYEFHNKGIDISIDSIGILNKDAEFKKEMVVFIFIPASHTGPRKDLIDHLNRNDFSGLSGDRILTHYLQGSDSDLILNGIKKNELSNDNSKVSLVYAPVYMDGNDGIFNMNYYDLLVGFDISVFPSYYEPWGYTPLESIAFHIPTITTNLTGFALAMRSQSAGNGNGFWIVDRNDNNDKEATNDIVSIVKEFSQKNHDEIQVMRHAVLELSKSAL